MMCICGLDKNQIAKWISLTLWTHAVGVRVENELDLDTWEASLSEGGDSNANSSRYDEYESSIDWCVGDGSKKGASSRPCGKHTVRLQLPRGEETHSIQLYCYDQEDGSRKKASAGRHGACLIPRTDYCNVDEQCRFGTTCRVSDADGRTTCQEGSDAGEFCLGNGGGQGACAKYTWVAVGQGLPQSWAYTRLYCLDVSSEGPSVYSYASEGSLGICKVWKDAPCQDDTQCWFGLFCHRAMANGEASGLCGYGTSVTYTESSASLVRQAATEAKELRMDRFEKQLDGSQITYLIMSPFAAALHQRNSTSHFEALLTTIHDAFVSATPAKFGEASRSGSSFYWSSDERWILKQIRPNEFDALVDYAHEAMCKKFRSNDWLMDNDLGMAHGSLLSIPVLAFNPGRWIVMPNSVSTHMRLLNLGSWQMPETFDLKPPPLISHERYKFLPELLTANGGNGLDIGNMSNFKGNTSNFEGSEGARFTIMYALLSDLLLLDSLLLVDYSALIEVYNLAGVGTTGVDLSYGCAADPSCSMVEPRHCTVICISLIDWLLRYVPGANRRADIENRLLSHKWSDYGSKTRLFIECIINLQQDYTPLTGTQSGNGNFVDIQQRRHVYGELYVATKLEVQGLPTDACSRRWYTEHNVLVDLTKDACRPFLSLRSPKVLKGEVEQTCGVGLLRARKKGVCLARKECHVTQSCAVVLGRHVNCKNLSIEGFPRMQTTLQKCVRYIANECKINYRNAYLSEAESVFISMRP